MKKCAFLTLDETADYVIDDKHAIKPLSELGWQVSTLSWRQTARPWGDFELVIIRSTWDYQNDVPAFLETLEHINTETLLANRLALVRWNLSKTYMRDLQQRGLGIVPTIWTDSLLAGFLATAQNKLGEGDIVVKPVVGASGYDTFRVSKGDSPERLQDIAARFENRGCMIQPFMPNIINEGEYSLFFFSGKYSHAVLKTPAGSEFRSQEERGARIRPIQPDNKLLRRAHEAMDTISPSPLYARIDLIRDETEDFLVMELELIEPSLYLSLDSKAPGRLAASIDLWARSA
jgi:glutathione synthase/RimK-type ligase-like ATP-grasp enzyme